MQKKLNTVELIGVVILAIAAAMFCRWQYASDWFEVSAFITTVIAIYLTAKEHIVSWPFNILAALIYAYVYWGAKLYADMTLQFFFVVLLISGWISWHRGGDDQAELKISRIQKISWLYIAVAIIVGTAIYKPVIEHFKGASPFWDTLLTVGSVVAQLLSNRKKIETWLLWVPINAIYVPLYWSRNLQATAILFGALLVIAIVGWVQWTKNLRAQELATP